MLLSQSNISIIATLLYSNVLLPERRRKKIDELLLVVSVVQEF